MKKGYACPTCGNKEPSDLDVIIPGRKRQSVLLTSNKILSTSNVQVCCIICKHQTSAEHFRIKRSKGI